MKLANVLNFGTHLAKKEIAERLPQKIEIVYKSAKSEEQKAKAVKAAMHALNIPRLLGEPELRQMMIAALRKRLPQVEEFKQLQ